MDEQSAAQDPEAVERLPLAERAAAYGAARAALAERLGLAGG